MINGETQTVAGLKVEAVPSYNIVAGAVTVILQGEARMVT